MRFLVLIAAWLSALPAYASEEKKMAVPQFDPSSFASQLFWLAICFAALYVLMAKVALPRVGFVIEQRTSKIEQDVDAAKTAAAEASSLQAGYEAALSTARNTAREQLGAANAAAIATQTQALAKQNAALVTRLQQAESTIAGAREAALANITPTAVATASAVLGKLAMVDIDAARLTTAVDHALKKA